MAMYERLVSEGLCVICGREIAAWGIARGKCCDDCLELVKERRDMAAAPLRRPRGESDDAYAARRHRMARAVKLIRGRGDPGARFIVDPDIDIDGE
jgi:hypothetical protein